MPTFYNFKQDGNTHSFDDVFIPVDAFRQGNLWTWGNNNYGQLGINDTTNRSTPVTTLSGGSNWKQVAGGSSHTAAIKTDGTLWTWGRADVGMIGTNDGTDRSTPVQIFAGGTNWKQVSCTDHTAAIKTDGTLWLWGYNIYGALGINETGHGTYRRTPITTLAGGSNWKQVSGGAYYTAAIKTDGTLWTWGHNANGQLGINDTTNRATPVTTFSGGTNWKQVSAGYGHCTAIKTDGTLWNWGRADNAQLGVNDTTQRNTPVTTFSGGTNWKQVSAGGFMTEAIKTDGTLWLWGRNAYGQLGTNGGGDRNTPVTTFAGGTNWKQVSAGYRQISAIKTDGTLWTWGGSTYGALGTNDATDRATPVTTFVGGTNWKQVACGLYHTLAIEYIDPVL